MNALTFKTALLVSTFALSLAACKKDDPPVPVEPELITTLKLHLTSSLDTQTFVYKVENGFGSNNQGTIHIDTIRLMPGTTYAVTAELLNEKETPPEDITGEVINEKDDHLFLYVSNPLTGAGSITATGGNTDNNGAPFNQKINFTSGAAGTGALTVYLMHEPSNKSGTAPATSGGETDVEAVFPVVIQ